MDISCFAECSPESNRDFGSGDDNSNHHDADIGPEDWKFLGQGVDSLDLGLFVDWNDDWQELTRRLQAGKEKAAGTDGVLWDSQECLILPSGRRPNFRWHLQWPDFHLFLGKSQTPQRATPNAYVSINAKPLWMHGVRASVGQVCQAVENLGGHVQLVKPSRCDLAADFLIPDGLSLDWIRSLRVPHNIKNSNNLNGDVLETFYVGAKDSPVQLRIYDKAKETVANGNKYWFLDVWQVDDCQDVWRVEFQLRRPFLKDVRVETIEDLLGSLGGIWRYLTEDWFSLRQLDDPNASRRTVHPFWESVQSCGSEFGDIAPIVRSKGAATPNLDWYVAHIAGCLVGVAARVKKSTLDDSLQALDGLLRDYWKSRDFVGQYRVKSIQLGEKPESAEDRP